MMLYLKFSEQNLILFEVSNAYLGLCMALGETRFDLTALGETRSDFKALGDLKLDLLLSLIVLGIMLLRS